MKVPSIVKLNLKSSDILYLHGLCVVLLCYVTERIFVVVLRLIPRSLVTEFTYLFRRRRWQLAVVEWIQ